jgi:hypothetical protein
MLVFEDAIVISLRPASVSFAMRFRSRPAQLHHRPARPRRDASIRIGLRTLILALQGVLTIAALLLQFGTSRPASGRCAMPDLTSTDLAREIRPRWLDVLIFLVSGYASTQLTARAAPNGVNEVVRKALQGRDLPGRSRWCWSPSTQCPGSSGSAIAPSPQLAARPISRAPRPGRRAPRLGRHRRPRGTDAGASTFFRQLPLSGRRRSNTRLH